MKRNKGNAKKGGELAKIVKGVLSVALTATIFIITKGKSKGV